jgi:hypothetical protein
MKGTPLKADSFPYTFGAVADGTDMLVTGEEEVV